MPDAAYCQHCGREHEVVARVRGVPIMGCPALDGSPKEAAIVVRTATANALVRIIKAAVPLRQEEDEVINTAIMWQHIFKRAHMERRHADKPEPRCVLCHEDAYLSSAAAPAWEEREPGVPLGGMLQQNDENGG